MNDRKSEGGAPERGKGGKNLRGKRGRIFRGIARLRSRAFPQEPLSPVLSLSSSLASLGYLDLTISLAHYRLFINRSALPIHSPTYLLSHTHSLIGLGGLRLTAETSSVSCG